MDTLILQAFLGVLVFCTLIVCHIVLLGVPAVKLEKKKIQTCALVPPKVEQKTM